jgi:tetratricopeptide (TPR) repeat protein
VELLAPLIASVSLASLTWAACPIASSPESFANQRSSLEDLRHTGYKYYREGQYQIATSCYAEALHMAEALGIGNAAVAGDLNNLGALAEGTGDYSQAGDYYLRELDLLARLHEANSETAGDVNSKFGQVMQIQGRFAQAESSYKKALALLTQHAGVENWQTAITINRLGRLYLEQGNFQEASSLLPRARAIAEKALPKDDPLLINFFDSEAYLLCQSHKFTTAEQKWTTALKIAEHAYGENGLEYASLLLHMGQMYSLMATIQRPRSYSSVV